MWVCVCGYLSAAGRLRCYSHADGGRTHTKLRERERERETPPTKRPVKTPDTLVDGTFTAVLLNVVSKEPLHSPFYFLFEGTLKSTDSTLRPDLFPFHFFLSPSFIDQFTHFLPLIVLPYVLSLLLPALFLFFSLIPLILGYFFMQMLNIRYKEKNLKQCLN